MKNLYTLFFGAIICTSFVSAQVPVLNSYPSASAVIYLDFDGQNVNGTSWNSGGPVTCAPSGMNATQIAEVFNRVAEDYRPFNLNVTTELEKYNAAPTDRRIRIILTTSYEWYGTAGGVSFVNSFSWGDNTPAFVFTSLLNFNAKNVAEATAHEAGHTLGLRHQAAYDNNCTKIADYNYGKGAGEIGWAPIMGAGYSQNLTLWNNGADPTGCSSIQDDLGIITSEMNGFGYREDDYANEIANATAATFNNNKFSLAGIIERNNDVDILKVSLPVKGRLHVDALPFSVASGNSGSDLDLQVEILNSAGAVIATYNPMNVLSATIDTTLNEGDYFLRVRGMGNVYAPNYASLGSYALNATYAAAAILPLHKLELSGITQNGVHKLNWEIVADENIIEQMVEFSTDGKMFESITGVGNATRRYDYSPQVNGTIYYRLKVKFDDGKQYFSNIIALKNELLTVRPHLVGNMVGNSMSVTSPAACTYAVYDFNGRTITKGSLSPGINTINAPATGSGIYIIQYVLGSQKFAEKFYKQ